MHQVFRSFFSLVVPILLIAFHFVIMLCFINRWDTVVTVTLVPIWMWAAFAILIALVGWLTSRNRLSLLVMLIWLATALVCSDETLPLLRTVKQWVTPSSETSAEPHSADSNQKTKAKQADNLTFSIVSLNCDKKSDPAAALKALASQLKPTDSDNNQQGDNANGSAETFDVVFLQEAPDDKVLREVTRELFGNSGTWLSENGCAILARGRLETLTLQFDFPNSVPGTQIAARLELEPGASIELVNVHLKRSIVRFDAWRREAWREHTELRIANRTRLKGILEALPESAVKRPRVIGGDFGTPYNDDIFRVLQLDFEDAFRRSGTGWGNTYPAKYPLLRIDQIWASKALTPLSASAVKTLHSDHRQVRVKFRISAPGGLLTVR